ncbi:MAG: very short patch repair endonuclease [Pyrinomonadaceae bacterium]
MADTVSRSKRTEIMSSVKQRHTKPEITVRKILHRYGFRFRLHNKKLPGTPDIVLAKYKAVIFVHGCFWHQHQGCRKSRRPTSNIEFWNEKLDRNIVRDNQKESELKNSGWKVLTLWDCEIKDEDSLIKKVKFFLHVE